MLDVESSYRNQIREEFLRRSRKNKTYSLRAFARDMTLDPGQLSSVINGKKNLSLSKASEVSKKLFKTPRDMLLFYHAVEYELAPAEIKAQIFIRMEQLSKSHTERASNVSVDEFETISDWFNLSLLELSGIKNVELTPELGAQYFGISTTEAQLGLMAMARLGFVKKVGKAFKKVKSLITTTEIPSLAIKRFHQQMIARAARAHFEQDYKKRYYTGATFKISPERLNELKKMMDEHEKRVHEFVAASKDDDGQIIYQLSQQLFSLREQDYE